MSNQPQGPTRDQRRENLKSWDKTAVEPPAFRRLRVEPTGSSPTVRPNSVMVEPDGIEPTTSCLQSTRSPN